METVSETIDLDMVMQTHMEFPAWDPAKETLTEHMERMKQEGDDIPVPEEQEDWDLLEDLYSLDNWTKLSSLILDKEVRKLQRQAIRAALRLAM